MHCGFSQNMFMAETPLHCLHATVLPSPNSSTFQDIVTENYEHECIVDLVKYEVTQSLKELMPTHNSWVILFISLRIWQHVTVIFDDR
jgi:hypothetical protein